MLRHAVILMALGWAAIANADRPDTPGTMATFRFAEDDVVERADFDRVRVHFTRSGVNSVPEADIDETGVPDFVELVGTSYDDVLTVYASWGFRLPRSDADLEDDNGGDERFDVYLVDFFGSADGSFQTDACDGGTCIGYAVQENDFVGYGYPSLERAVGILSSHELFHAVQAAYDDGQNSVVGEGTAVWASDRFNPRFREVPAFAPGYFERADRPIDQPLVGAVLDAFGYGASVFFTFLTEHLGDEDLVLRLWEDCVDGARGVEDPQWLPALIAMLERDYDTEFETIFVEFATWNWFTAGRANPDRAYAEGIRYPEVNMRDATLPFEDVRPRHFRAATRYYRFSAGGRDEVRARLVGDGAADLRLRLIDLDTGALSDVRGTEIAAPGAPSMALAIINPSPAGSSRRATLCLGTEMEVDRCERLHAEEDDASLDASFDSSVADAHTPDARVSDAGGGDTEPGSPGGGCSAGGSGNAFFGFLVLGILLRKEGP
ncbi:MAG: MXAN_6640 family putative metalloprotease [Myxococcota bacterium]